MKIRSFVFAFLMVSAGLHAQIDHSLSGVFKMLMDSEIAYEIKELKEEIPAKDYSKNLNGLSHCQVMVDNRIQLKPFNEKTNPFFLEAEKRFDAHPDSAYRYYMLAYESDTLLTKALTYAGQTLEILGQDDRANELYIRSIDKNPIDYMAHWFLADGYSRAGDLKKAEREIAMARVLNRNNPRVLSAFNKIMEKTKRSTKDWYFTPQYRITKKDSAEFDLEYSPDWMGYLTAKAAWKCEPSYAASQLKSGEDSTYTEERDCLLLFSSYLINAKLKNKKDLSLSCLKKALEKHYFNEYLLFEVILPEYPRVAYQLPKDKLERICDYILNIRQK